MERRIKILNLLTIVAIVAFCSMQCYWLYNRYIYTLESHEEELYHSVIDIMKEEHELRKALKSPDISILTGTKISASTKAGTQSVLNTVFDIYVIDLNEFKVTDITNTDMKEIVELYETSKPNGISHYKFDITDKPASSNEYEALERFTVNVRNPFNQSRLDSLLNKHGIAVEKLIMEKADSMVWLSSYSNPLVSHKN